MVLRLVVAILAGTSCSVAMLSCSRAPDRVVVVHLSEPNEMSRGVLRVATNEPILVVIDRTQEVLRVDCGGMLLIPERDWVGMLRLLRAQVEPIRKEDYETISNF